MAISAMRTIHAIHIGIGIPNGRHRYQRISGARFVDWMIRTANSSTMRLPKIIKIVVFILLNFNLIIDRLSIDIANVSNK